MVVLHYSQKRAVLIIISICICSSSSSASINLRVVVGAFHIKAAAVAAVSQKSLTEKSNAYVIQMYK